MRKLSVVRNALCSAAARVRDARAARAGRWRRGGLLAVSELLLPSSATHRHRGDSDLPALQGPLPLRHAVQPGAPHALVLRVRVLPAAGQAPQGSVEVRTAGEPRAFRGNQLTPRAQKYPDSVTN